jgi:hypothetical protein
MTLNRGVTQVQVESGRRAATRDGVRAGMTPRGAIVRVFALAMGGEVGPAKNICFFPNMSQNEPSGTSGTCASGPGSGGAQWPELDLWL